MQQPRQLAATIAKIEWITSDCYRLYIKASELASNVKPGQFFMLRLAEHSASLLPRPFSIYRVQEEYLVFLIKTLGGMTQQFGQAMPGRSMQCTGPLGQPFPSISAPGVIMLAGGIGIAPFVHFVQELLRTGTKAKQIDLVFGSANKAMLYDLPLWQSFGINIFPATDDGGYGFKGNALQCLNHELKAGKLDRSKTIIACGPERMLEAAHTYAHEHSLDLYLSLETYMACGIGICNGCSVAVEPSAFDDWPYAKACCQGPTFKSSHLKHLLSK